MAELPKRLQPPGYTCRSTSPQAVGKLGRGLRCLGPPCLWPASVRLTPFIPGFHTTIIIFSIYRDPKTVGRFHLRWASLRSIVTGGLPVHTVTPPGHQVAPAATWARCGSLQTTLCYPDIQWKPLLCLGVISTALVPTLLPTSGVALSLSFLNCKVKNDNIYCQTTVQNKWARRWLQPAQPQHVETFVEVPSLPSFATLFPSSLPASFCDIYSAVSSFSGIRHFKQF